jgi:hypothetical protein
MVGEGDRNIEELDSIVRDESKSLEERIEAAKEIYELSEKVTVPAIYPVFLTYSIDELDRYIKGKERFPSKLEEVLIKAAYEYKINKLRDMDIVDVAKICTSPGIGKAEKEICRQILEERKDELDIALRALQIAEIERAERKRSVARGVGYAEHLSLEEVESIDDPTKWYAKEAFEAGLWNERWGNPMARGINVVSSIRYVDRPKNRDFVKLMISLNLWNERWGNIEKYISKFKI